MAVVRVCGVGAPLGSAGKKRAAPRALLPVDAGPRGGERRRPRGGRATAPWACPFSQHREKSGGGLLNLHCGCGIVRSTLERSRGLRLLPGPSGASWGLRLLPGPSGASWGLRLPPGPSGASWGLRLLPGALSLPAKPIWRWCGSVWVGAPWVRQGRSAQRPGRSFLSTPAREGRASAPPRRACDRPWACPFSQHREKSGGGLLNLHCGCGIVRSTLERSRGLRLLPGPSGPPGASGYSRGPLGPPGASGYSRGPLGPPGASGYSRGPFHSLLNRYGGGAGLCGWVRPWVRQGRSAQRPGRSFLSTPAREGRASAPPRRACDRPLGLSLLSTS